MRKVRIAQIGTSRYSHGNMIFDTLKKRVDLFEIVGYCFPENEREKFPEAIQRFEGYKELSLEEILNDKSIEAVAIETEEIYLTKYALLAARAGKHIHMEKPGGICLEDFEALIAEVKANGKVFHTGYMYRYNPEIRRLMEQVKNDELGEIISVEAQMNCDHNKETREWLQAFPDGITFFLGCHLIDLIVQIQGFPTKIHCLNKSTGRDGLASKDLGMVVLEYPNGLSYAKVNTNEIGGFMRRQLVVCGTKKTVVIQPLEAFAGDKLSCTVKEYESHGWGDVGKQRASDLFDRYEDMIVTFGEMVKGSKKNPYSYEYELELYRTILRCCGK